MAAISAKTRKAKRSYPSESTKNSAAAVRSRGALRASLRARKRAALSLK